VSDVKRLRSREDENRRLAKVDDYTRDCLCLVAGTSLSSLPASRELDAFLARRGRPHGCVSGTDTDLTGMAILRRSPASGAAWHYTAPGKPTQNDFIQSVNGRLPICPIQLDVIPSLNGNQ